MARWSTVLSGVFLALSMVLSLGKLLMLAAGTGNNGELTEADQWLIEIGLPQYRSVFRQKVCGCVLIVILQCALCFLFLAVCLLPTLAFFDQKITDKQQETGNKEHIVELLQNLLPVFNL